MENNCVSLTATESEKLVAKAIHEVWKRQAEEERRPKVRCGRQLRRILQENRAKRIESKPVGV